MIIQGDASVKGSNLFVNILEAKIILLVAYYNKERTDEKFEDTIAVIKSHKSMKDRQYNGQIIKENNNDLQPIHGKRQIEKHEPH